VAVAIAIAMPAVPRAASAAGTEAVTIGFYFDAEPPAGMIPANLAVRPAAEPYNRYVGGQVEVREGSTLLGTFAAYQDPTAGIGPNIALGPLPSGTHTLTARYSGDETFAPATRTVIINVVLRTPTSVGMWASAGTGPFSCAPTYGSECPPSDVAQGTPVTLYAAVRNGTDPAPPPGMPPSTFTFFDNGQVLVTAPADNGDTSAVVTLAPGSHVLNVRYDGDPYYAALADIYAWAIRVDGDTGGSTPTTTPTTTPLMPRDPVVRYAGADRVATAVAISQASFADHAAKAAVLASSDGFADALTGTPLAVARGGPLLVTPSRATIDERVAAELQRVLPRGQTVFVLGGERALPAGVADHLRAAGYAVERYAGADRFETATAVATIGLSRPTYVLLADGRTFADALAGGAAAAHIHGAVLLTDGSTLPTATRDYLHSQPAGGVFALGGPAAAAAPSAAPIVGADRYDTAVRVAWRFFTSPAAAAVAGADTFADALAGGAHIAGRGGPLLLTAPQTLPDTTRSYLAGVRASVATAYLYGGSVAVSDTVETAVRTAIN
jgi:hypothetical protein